MSSPHGVPGPTWVSSSFGCCGARPYALPWCAGLRGPESLIGAPAMEFGNADEIEPKESATQPHACLVVKATALSIAPRAGPCHKRRAPTVGCTRGYLHAHPQRRPQGAG